MSVPFLRSLLPLKGPALPRICARQYHCAANRVRSAPDHVDIRGSHYSLITERAARRKQHVSHDHACALLSQFIDAKYDSSRLLGFLDSSVENWDRNPSLDDYFVILKLCSLLALRDLDLVSSLSEQIRLSFLESYSRGRDKRCATQDVPESDAAGADQEATTLPDSREDGRSIPPLMDSIRTVSVLYNELNILYDALFKTTGQLLLEHQQELTTGDVELLLRTYANQNYRDHAIIAKLVSYVEENSQQLDPATAVSVYRSLGRLELLGPEVTAQLEQRFCERLQEGSAGARLLFKASLSPSELIDVGYTKFIQGSTDSDSFWFVKCALESVIDKISSTEELTSTDSRSVTVLAAFLKCLSEPCYNSMKDETIEKLREVISVSNKYKKHGSTKFVEKVSQHLTKLRIRHETNVYFNGILLDIVERPRNVVWLCNSYHRFYAGSFDLTAERKALERLIRAFGFKICVIQYYQWGRMKLKRTRFAYIRMARYYAISDRREYDHRYAGWSLPYVWWNVSRQDQMHIANYIKYDP